MTMSVQYPAGQIEANGVTVPIFVTDDGNWQAEFDGRTQSYPTREKLENRLKTLTRQSAVRVEIPVIKVERTYDGARFIRATLTGIHGANGNVLGVLHYGDRRGDVKEQFSRSYGSSETFFGGDLTDEQLKEYAELRRVASEAGQAVREAEKRYEIKDVKAMVQRVIDAQSGSGAE
jgi:hypothetical protein